MENVASCISAATTWNDDAEAALVACVERAPFCHLVLDSDANLPELAVDLVQYLHDAMLQIHEREHSFANASSTAAAWQSVPYANAATAGSSPTTAAFSALRPSSWILATAA